MDGPGALNLSGSCRCICRTFSISNFNYLGRGPCRVQTRLKRNAQNFRGAAKCSVGVGFCSIVCLWKLSAVFWPTSIWVTQAAGKQTNWFISLRRLRESFVIDSVYQNWISFASRWLAFDLHICPYIIWHSVSTRWKPFGQARNCAFNLLNKIKYCVTRSIKSK